MAVIRDFKQKSRLRVAAYFLAFFALAVLGVIFVRRSAEERFWKNRSTSLSLENQLGDFYGKKQLVYKDVEHITPNVIRSLLYIPANQVFVIEYETVSADPTADRQRRFNNTKFGGQPFDTVF